MLNSGNTKFLFFINPSAGSNTKNLKEIIVTYFKPLNHTIEIFSLTKSCNEKIIGEKIKLFAPQKVVAVGGDGTVKLIAAVLINTNIALGILPTGSANGLASELGINGDLEFALDVLVKGCTRKIHVVKINGQICIHLSDIGLNALAIKKFQRQGGRGMWGYFVASLKALCKPPVMEVEMLIVDKKIKIKASIIVIANATKYGSGAIINPIGNLEDKLFEVVVVKKISFLEIFKMIVSHAAFNSDKTEIFQTNSLLIQSKRKVHFQIDGEYIGKVNEVDASIIPSAISIIVPEKIIINY